MDYLQFTQCLRTLSLTSPLCTVQNSTSYHLMSVLSFCLWWSVFGCGLQLGCWSLYWQFTHRCLKTLSLIHITAVYCAEQHKLPSDVSIVILHVVKCVGLWITVRLWITLLTVHTSVFEDIKPHSHHSCVLCKTAQVTIWCQYCHFACGEMCWVVDYC